MSVFTGPAPDVKRDRWGRPLIAPPQPLGADPVPYTRATTVAKTLEDQSALMAWKQRMTTLGLVARRDLLTAAAATDVEDKKSLNRITEQAADAGGSTAAATTGTALHAFTERLDRGLDLGHVPAEHEADLEAYQRLAEEVGWKVKHVEEFTVLDPYKVAGTADRVLEIDGRWYIADVKTGSSAQFHHAWAVQLAIYSRALPYDIEQGTRLPWDVVPDQERALVIHLPAERGTADAYWLDIASGWEAFQLSMRAREWRRRKDLLTAWAPELEAATDPIAEAIASAAYVSQLNAVWEAHHEAWTDEHTALAKARKDVLTQSA